MVARKVITAASLAALVLASACSLLRASEPSSDEVTTANCPRKALPPQISVVCSEVQTSPGEPRILECSDRYGNVFQLIRPNSLQRTN